MTKRQHRLNQTGDARCFIEMAEVALDRTECTELATLSALRKTRVNAADLIGSPSGVPVHAPRYT